MFKKLNLKIVAIVVGVSAFVGFNACLGLSALFNGLASKYINGSDTMFWHYQNYVSLFQNLSMICLIIGLIIEAVIGASYWIKAIREEEL